MNIIGHLLIAASVRNTVFRQTGARLSLPGFLYGNILTDLSARYGRNPHFFAQSFSYVLDCSQKLEADIQTAGISSFFCSRDAGVITHYLSDFFCYAHSEQCPYSIYRHHWYEFCMLRQFRSGLLFCRETQPASPSRVSALGPFICAWMDEYRRVCGEKKRDFYFAMEVSLGAVVCEVRQAQCRAGSRLPVGWKTRLFVFR